jgi:hypothetical protein
MLPVGRSYSIKGRIARRPFALQGKSHPPRSRLVIRVTRRPCCVTRRTSRSCIWCDYTHEQRGMVSLATQEVAMEKIVGEREINTLLEVELFIALEDAELETVSGGRRNNDDDVMKDLQIQR